MFTTLDQLHHHHQQQRSWFTTFHREIKIIAAICVTVFVVNSLVTNAQLYAEAVQDIIQSTGVSIPGLTNTDNSRSILYSNNNSIPETIIDHDYLQQKTAVENITTSVAAMNLPQTEDFPSANIINSNLQQWLDSYTMHFNTLPPTSRIIIPRLAVNAPLVQSSASKPVDELTKDDFDKDLFHGVVQDPTTPNPGKIGNMLLFGHTSYEAWKQNPYATIFSGLPQLEHSDTMQVISEWKVYTYKVIDKKVVSPSKVNQEYKKYMNGKYLTLLWCYPIWSDAQRIMIIGQLIE